MTAQLSEQQNIEKNHEIIFEEVSRDFRTEIPKIVFYLLKHKKISNYAFVLYSVLRETAGEHGLSWKSQRTLADDCYCSTKKICEAKIELQQSFEELDGNSLIHLVRGDPKKNETDRIFIRDIWKYNHRKFKRKSANVMELEGGSYSATPGSYSPTPGAIGTERKNPIKKEPLEETTNNACARETVIPIPSSDSVVVFSSKNSLKQGTHQTKSDQSKAVAITDPPTQHNIYYRKSPGEPPGKEQSPKIYACIENEIRLTHQDKISLTKRFSEPLVAKSYAKVTHPTFKVKNSLYAILNWFCENPDKFDKNAQDWIQENTSIATKYFKECFGDLIDRFTKKFNQTFIEFIPGKGIVGHQPGNDPNKCYFSLELSDPNFGNALPHKLQYWGIWKPQLT